MTGVSYGSFRAFISRVEDFHARWNSMVLFGSRTLHTFLITGGVSIWHIDVMFMSCIYTVYFRICFIFFHTIYNKRHYREEVINGNSKHITFLK